MKALTAEEKSRITEEVIQFIAQELDVPLERITPETRIVDDLGGDSLIYIEIVEELKERYDIQQEIRLIGQYFMDNRIATIQEIVDAVCDIIDAGVDFFPAEQKH